MKENNLRFGLLVASFAFTTVLSAQTGQLVDQVDAVIGSKVVLHSEVQDRYLQYLEQSVVTNNTRCFALEDLMYQKLLLTEAEKDTNMVVSDAQLDGELNKRLEYFISKFGGSKEKFEAFYGKTVDQ